MTEESIYGVILVSGLIVVSGVGTASSLNAFVTVVVTVIVFFAAHVYAGALARLAVSAPGSGWHHSVNAAALHSAGMLVASVPPLVVLLLGATRVIDDGVAIWTALIVNTLLLGILGWVAIARWNPNWTARIVGALITAAFGGVLILVKAIVTH